MTVAAIAILVSVVVVVASISIARRSMRRTPPLASPETRDDCVRCGRKIEVDPQLSRDVFEGMHWLCFHLEYEHSTDPDVPCTDIAGCPWWVIRYYEDRLRELGLEPKEVMQAGLERQLDRAPQDLNISEERG